MILSTNSLFFVIGMVTQGARDDKRTWIFHPRLLFIFAKPAGEQPFYYLS